MIIMYFDLCRLNEGHTVYVERRITGRLHDDEALRQFMAMGGSKDMKENIVNTLHYVRELTFSSV